MSPSLPSGTWTVVYQGPQFNGLGFWLGLVGALACLMTLMCIYMSRKKGKGSLRDNTRRNVVITYCTMMIFMFVSAGDFIVWRRFIVVERNYHSGNFSTIIGCVGKLLVRPTGDGRASEFSIGDSVFAYHQATSGFGYNGTQMQLANNLRVRVEYMPEQPFPEDRIMQIAIARPDCQ